MSEKRRLHRQHKRSTSLEKGHSDVGRILRRNTALLAFNEKGMTLLRRLWSGSRQSFDQVILYKDRWVLL